MARAKPKQKPKPKRKSKPAGKRKAGPSASVPPFARRGLIVLTIVVLLLVLVGLGLTRLRAYVNSRPEYTVHLDRVQVLKQPSWLSDDEWESLRRDAKPEGARGLYDGALVDDLRAAWGRSPMVAGTPTILRRHPNRVSIDLVVRRPVVAIKDFGDADAPCVLVDREAVVWPGRFEESIPARFGPMLVVKCYPPATFGRTPKPGHAWRDERVLHGLAVAMQLREGLGETLTRKLRLRTIVVTHVGTDEPDRSEIVLETADDVKIEWGRSPVSPRAARELPLETKLANLRQVYLNPDELHGKTVRIRFDPPTIAE